MSSTKSIFQSYSVLQNISLPSYTIPPVDDVEKENKPFSGHSTIGGVLSNTEYIWKANGSLFTLYYSKTGAKIASWNFGSVIKSSTTTVSCVVELPRSFGKLPFLIVGLQSDTHGQICIFKFIGSRVLRCIEIDERVTSLSIIEANHEASSLGMSLQVFDGVVAVGTSGGNVYLVDINCLECEEVLKSEVNIRDEINPCQLEVVFLDEQLERNCPDKHMCIILNAEVSDVECFVLRGPKDDVRVFVNKEEVEVSALHYCPQLGSLLIGFNFGAWQLWDLINMKLIYTSPVYEQNIPVSHFGVQEPCDDPRAFCYVWTVYSNTEPYQPGYSLAVLYSLNYENKEVVEGHGILYKNLTSCSVRFQMDVTSCQNGIDKSNSTIRAQCINLQTIRKAISRNSFEDNHDETLTVCSTVWNVWNSNLPKKCETYLCLFDLNQWYKEQMPDSLNSKDCQTYLSHVCLSNILKNYDKQKYLLNVRINPDTLNQFMGCQRLEEHYHPSSLAFQIIALEETSISTIENKGTQRALLTSLEKLGPSALLKPTETFVLSINLGLTPLFLDAPNKTPGTIEHQRNFLLSLALEQKLLGWLCKCVSTWSSGVYESSGCSLNFLLLWGWQRAQVLKENADNLSVILFDYSGLRLDSNTHNLLSHCSRQLKTISTLFKFIVRKYLGFVLNPDVVKDQCESLEMVCTHLEVVEWLLNIGLLPECPEGNYPRNDEFGRINAPYPINSLNKYYDNRRNELDSLPNRHFFSNDKTLFIDSLVEIEFNGRGLQKEWNSVLERAEYPPQSLQALVRTYLVENVSLLYKHCVIAYVLLDISASLDENQYQSTITHLLKFPAVFHLGPSLTKVIQSFWQLDHGNFQAAIEQLIDPMISSNDLKVWHHKLVLKTLLAHEQHTLALFYLQVRRPPITEVNDLCLILSLYIVNNMIDEAFHFQRQNQSLNVSERLLHHFYKECDKIGKLKSILFLPLSKEEEDAFIKYLNDVNHPRANELKIYYYTQHSRYLDAVRIYDKTGRIKTASRGLEGQHLLSDTDSIINKLNKFSNPLSKSIMDVLKNKNMKEINVPNPQPFSVFIHNSEEQVKYKSSVIEAALVKTKEIWNQSSLSNTETTITNTGIYTDIPFLSTLKATLSTSKVLTPIIYPKLMFTEDEDGPSPPKKFKPTSRFSILTGTREWDPEVTCRKLSVRLDTPVVKRKRSKTIPELIRIESHQSILKSQTQKLANSSQSDDKNQPHDFVKDNIHTSFNTNRNTTSKSRTSLILTPRRSLLGNSRHAVRFSFSKTPPSECSTTSNSSDTDFEIIRENALVHSPLDGKDDKPNDTLQEEESTSFDIKKSDSVKAKESFSGNVIGELPKTPRSRRSYREQPSEIRVRSSQRLQKLKKDESNAEDISVDAPSTQSNESVITLDSPKEQRSRRNCRELSQHELEPEQSVSKVIVSPPRSKLQGRRSLTRKVLENNTFNKIVEIQKTSTFATSFQYLRKEVINQDDSLDTTVTDDSICSKTSTPVDITTKQSESIESKLSEVSNEKLNDQVVEEETSAGEYVAVMPKETEVEYNSEELLLKDANADGRKNFSNDVNKIDINIYEDEYDDYETVDPKLNVFDESNDLTFNEAVCADDNILELETNSNYLDDYGGVFGDDHPLDENITEVTVNLSNSNVLVNEHEKNINVTMPESKISSECTISHSSASSDVEVIELSSSSGDNNEDRTSSDVEDVYSTENESSVNSADSKESTSTNSNVLYEYNINSKDIISKSCHHVEDKKETSGECSKSSSDNVPVEEVQENIEVSTVYETQNSELHPVCEDINEDCVSSEKLITYEVRETKNNAITDVELTESKVEPLNPIKEVADENDQSQSVDVNTEKIESNSEVEDKVRSSDNKLYVNVIEKDNNFEAANITPKYTVDDTNRDTNITNKGFMASTPSAKEENWDENMSCGSDILSETINRSNSYWLSPNSILSKSEDHHQIINDSNTSDYLNNTPQHTPIDSLNNSFFDDIFASKHGTPVRRSQRISSLHTPDSTDLRKYTLRKRSLSASNSHVGVDTLKLKKVLSKVTEKQMPTKRKRSSSTNTQSPVPTRTKRGASVDVELITRENTQTGVDKSSNISESKKKGTFRKSKSAIITNETNIATYSSSRRLTRRQAELLKKNLGAENIELKDPENSNSDDSSHSPSRGPDIVKMDALKLLDKKSFEGDPDPDEQLVNKSTESSLADSPIGSRLRNKSSNASVSSETSPTLSETRKTRSKRRVFDGDAIFKSQQRKSPEPQTQNEAVPKKLRKKRLKSKDTDVSDASTISQAHSVIEVKKVGKITRRTRSMTEDIEQPILRRSERNVSSKCQLPKIVEERHTTEESSKKATYKTKNK